MIRYTMNDLGAILVRLGIVVFFVGLFTGFVVFMAGIPVASVPAGVVAFALENPLMAAFFVVPVLLFLFFFSRAGRGPSVTNA